MLILMSTSPPRHFLFGKTKTRQNEKTDKNIICFHLQRVQECNSCLIFLTLSNYYRFMEFMFPLPLGPREIHKYNRMPKHRGKASSVCGHQPCTKTILPIHFKPVFTSSLNLVPVALTWTKF